VSRRLFFALWPADDTRAALVETCRTALKACGGRAVPPRHYHVTLAFLGNVPAEQIDRFTGWTAVESCGFDLVFDRFGHWRGPQVLWIGPGQCPAGLTVLAARLRTRLDTLDIHFDRRDFKAHLTLARKVRVLPELPAPTPVHWPVHDFVLVESVDTSGGPVYEVARRFPIGSVSPG